MAKKKKKSRKNEQEIDLNEPWIGRQSGLLVVGLFSIAFAGFVAWQLSAGLGWFEAILWGLGFGLAMWAVFGLSLAFNTWLRKRR